MSVCLCDGYYLPEMRRKNEPQWEGRQICRIFLNEITPYTYTPPPDFLSLLAFDWSSPAVADVRRALLWMSPRARASILPPIGAPKTPEEERRCKRCQVRVRCSFDADSKDGQPGLFCLFNRGFSSILRTPSPRSSSPGLQRRGGTAAKTNSHKSDPVLKVLMRLCVRVCAFVRRHVLCMVQWSCG